MNNYRLDIFFRGTKYEVEFPEYWLAKTAGEAIAKKEEETKVFLLERMSDNKFDVTRRIK